MGAWDFFQTKNNEVFWESFNVFYLFKMVFIQFLKLYFSTNSEGRLWYGFVKKIN